MTKNITVAICYDFDGTLSPTNMQEYDFLPALGISPVDFWRESNEEAKLYSADPILMYMKLMLDKTFKTNVKITKKSFTDFGKNIQLFEGVPGWFDRINEYGKKQKITIEHYIISSGIKEMLEGLVIKKHFKEIYACSYVYDQNDVAIWPGVAVNYTTKTQFLFRINKGVLNLSDNESVNELVPEEDRRIPFSRMIYLGDGLTDIPCMKLVKDKGGHSVAVYASKLAEKKSLSERLKRDGRVNFMAEADYREGSQLDSLIKSILDHLFTKHRLEMFEGKQN
jgi:2-hydroxy-3-keto-5-methylthiopentenyl-1-phosphate phosphatase